MLRQTVLPFCLMAALTFTAAHAAAPGDGPRAYARSGEAPHRAHNGPRPDDGRDAPPDADSAPHIPVGFDAGYDYSAANNARLDADPYSHPTRDDPYYQYMGPQPEDPRAREQLGLRDGRLPIAPRTPWYAGVRLYGVGYGYGYGYGRGYGCGCEHYRRRYTVYYDDFGIRGASYPGYSYRHHEDYGRGYGD